MDASSVAATALAVAVANSRDAALSDFLLERELSAMRETDLRSFVAARDFVANALVRAPAVPATWRQAAVQVGNDWRDTLGVMRAALRDLRRGQSERAEQRLSMEVSESDEEEEEEEEEEETDDESIFCVLCRSSDGQGRNFVNMAAEGRWAGLAPGARILCSVCYTEEHGRVESFF